MPPAPRFQRIWPPILVATMIIALGLRLFAILVLKSDPTHDEAITLMSTAAGQGAFARSLPGLLDEPLPAAEVQRFLTTAREVAPRQVAEDLALHDIHPPLYFQLMHLVRASSGIHLKGLLLINVLLGLLYLPLLFALVTRLGGDARQGLITAALWYLSPAVLDTDLEARPYTLLGLLALSSWLLGHDLLFRGITVRRIALFIGVNALGLLTHYYFSLLLVPFVRYAWRHPASRSGVLAIAAPVSALLVFLLAFPPFFDFLRHFPPPAISEPSPIGTGMRTLYALLVPMGFFTVWPLLRYACAVLLMLLLLRTIMLRWRSDGVRPVGSSGPSTGGYLGDQLLWSFAFSTVLYVAGVPPAQAVGGPYYAYLWPLVAAWSVHAVHRLVPTGMHAPLMALITVQALLSSGQVLRRSANLEVFLPASWQLPAGAVMLTDDPRRGHLSRLALRLAPTDTLVVVTKATSWEPVTGRDVYVLRRSDRSPETGPLAELMAHRGSEVIAANPTHQLLRMAPGARSTR